MLEGAPDPREWIGQHRNMGGLFCEVDDLADVSWVSLRTALMALTADSLHSFERDTGASNPDAVVHFSSHKAGMIDDKFGGSLDVWIELEDGDLCVVAIASFEGGRPTNSEVHALVSPMVREAGAKLVLVSAREDSHDETWDGYWEDVHIWIRPRLRATSVRQAYDLADAARHLLLALANGVGIDATRARQLIVGGQGRALLGMTESEWLEAKAVPWDTTTLPGKVELAKDVSSFANGHQDALIVVGLGTRKSGSSDVLIRGPGSPIDPREAQRHADLLLRYVYPPIDGIQITVTGDGEIGDLLTIFIPAQPEELKPFIVGGSHIGVKVDEGFFGIYRRQGDRSVPATPQALHSTMAAGRALLRHGVVHVDNSDAKARGQVPRA